MFNLKRGLLSLILFGLLINLVSFVSAYTYDRYFGGGTSFGDLLNTIDPSTMVLAIIFIVAFALLFFSLSKALRGEKVIVGIVSFALSLLIVYGINRSGFDIENIFYNIGINFRALNIILPLFIMIIVIIIIIKVMGKKKPHRRHWRY